MPLKRIFVNYPGGRLRVYEALTSQKNCLRILYFMYCASLAAWQPLLAVYFNEIGISGLQIGIILSIAPIMVFLVQPLWGVAADRFGRHRTLLFAMFFIALFVSVFIVVIEAEINSKSSNNMLLSNVRSKKI